MSRALLNRRLLKLENPSGSPESIEAVINALLALFEEADRWNGQRCPVKVDTLGPRGDDAFQALIESYRPFAPTPDVFREWVLRFGLGPKLEARLSVGATS